MVRVYVWLSLLLFALVIIFSSAHLTITITPRAESKSFDREVTILSRENKTNLNKSEDTLEGSIYDDIIHVKSTTGPLGGQTVMGKAHGTVTVENHYSKAQPLVQGTRLVTPEGILFRTTQTITVPAGGSVTVDIEADANAENGIIGPSRFTIVALWKGIQNLIYATSTEPTTAETSNSRIITQEDINRASQTVTDLLRQQGLDNAARALGKNTQQLSSAFSMSDLTIAHSRAVGDSALEFETDATAHVTALDISQSDVQDVIRKKIASSLSPELELYALTGITIKSISAQAQNSAFKITVHADALIIPRYDALIDKSALLGKSAAEIQQQLSSLPRVSELKVAFFPPWMKRSLAFEDRIDVQIRAPAQN